MRRTRSLEIHGVTHGGAPIPMGARVGNVLYSSGIPGKDPATDSLPDDIASQARFAFENMQALLTAGGSTLDHLVRMTVYIKDNSVRAAVNDVWLRCFPDPHDRPARHTLVYDLPGGMLVQLEVVAIIP
ncbi:2-iminobutanoate/2-iminopropanoate deaminase [Paraburkholderia sartisoli]|uniref:2-iminobutanoate/2-iminopropanoate deaminase n=2 Tax=Paraburkholderia sartisoli TaxID=83784 RepID=A0A1H4GRH5_9BURK|nr:2-iminobutanoate/2-iminopropanoate deaminase [Paraburkholderia sartisoli]